MKDTGGSAFPTNHYTRNQTTGEISIYDHSEGMTLRDYFAGQAVIGLLTQGGDIQIGRKIYRMEIASYMIADAMIKERNK